MKFGMSCLQEEGFPYHSIEEISHLLRRFTKEKVCDQAHNLYESLKKHGLESHPLLGNHLTAMLAELGSINDAHHVFNKLSEWSSSTTNQD
mgnify:CR=1 FL=1